MSLLMAGAANSVAALLGTADRSTNIELITCVSSGLRRLAAFRRYRLVNSRRAGGRYRQHARHHGDCQPSYVRRTYHRTHHHLAGAST
jgi:hypothetical protein